MQIIPVQVFGEIETLSYFYVGENSKSFIIDPGAEADKLKRVAEDKKLDVSAVLLTHTHFDHIGAAAELAKYWKAPIYGGANSKKCAEDTNLNLSAFTTNPILLYDVIEKNEGDTIALDEKHSLKIIETPGHTADGAVYYDAAHNIAFVGDTIFENSYGRTDFPGGSEKILFKSIKEKIFALPDDTTLFSGHSAPTTVAAEKTRSYYG